MRSAFPFTAKLDAHRNLPKWDVNAALVGYDAHEAYGKLVAQWVRASNPPYETAVTRYWPVVRLV